jgi:hypothetical protein
MRASGTPGFALLALLGLLPACGGGLYTAEGLPPLNSGGGNTCNANEVACGPAQTCTPVVSDPLNCGGCNNVCSGAPAGASNVCEARSCTFACPLGHLRNVTNHSCDVATAVSGGGAHTCALGAGGRLFCWGSNSSGQIPGGPAAGVDHPFDTGITGVTLVAAGVNHTCALVGTTVQCWGAVGSPSPSPSGVLELSSGLGHSCARLGSGSVTCWGTGPALSVPSLANAVRVTSGASHACALDGGTVRCWGDPAQSKLAGEGLGGMAFLAAGRDFACAASGLDVTPQLLCWGDNGSGQIPLQGNPVTTPSEPQRASGNPGIIRMPVAGLASGRTHTCVFGDIEGVKCFGGDNALGQLGGTPTVAGDKVDVANTVGASSLTAGADHSCAIFADGKLYCWGANGSGQLGIGNQTQPAAPGPLPIIGS